MPPSPADHLRRAQLLPWLVRVLWVALPFTAGPALAYALHPASGPVRTLASLGLWAGWAAGVLAVLVPRPIGLTTLRVLGPAAALAAVAAAVAGHPSALALGWAVAVTAWVFTPAVGSWCVNGAAYPNERRFLLRAPGALLVGPLAVAWALALAGLVAGPLLLAAHRWLAGATAALVGLPLAALLLRSIHLLSRRWAVFVPAGLVLHDPVTLADPFLFRRQQVEGLRPAPADSNALDLTQRAPGLALELTLVEEVDLILMQPGNRQGRPTRTSRLLFTPTRPGALLEEAQGRRLRVTL